MFTNTLQVNMIYPCGLLKIKAEMCTIQTVGEIKLRSSSTFPKFLQGYSL